MPQYLSTDPNEGLTSMPSTTKYLSTDPNEGSDPQPEETPSMFGRGLDVLSRVGNTLGRLGSATAAVAKEGVEGYQQGQSLGNFASDAGTAIKDTFTPTGIGQFKRNDDFDKVLAQGGMDEGWKRSALGFVGDVVIDPINLIPGAVLAKGIKAPFKAAGKLAEELPGVSKLKGAVEKAFVPHAGLEKFAANTSELNFKEAARLHESSLRHEGEAAEALRQDFIKGNLGGVAKARSLSPDDAKKVIYAVDSGVSTLGDPRLDQAIGDWRKIMDEQFQAKVNMGAVDPAKKITDYVPYQTTNASKDAIHSVSGAELKGKTQSDKARKVYTTLADAVKHGGASEDAGEILAKHVAQTQKAARTNEFLAFTGQEFGSTTATAGSRMLDRKMFNVPDQTWRALEGKHFPKEVADHLEKAVQLWEKPEELDTMYKGAVKLWKSLATSANPAHHFTNFLGNVANMNVMGGMPMHKIAGGITEATKIMAPELLDGKAVLPAAGKYTAKELTALARKYEILGTSTQLGETAGKGVSNIAPLRVARQWGTKIVEEPARLALFLHEVRNGKSAEKAALKVKNVLFDYSEITDFEKGIRDTGVIPFYTWMRKNLPAQIMAAANNPKGFERVTNLTNVPWNANQTKVNQTVISEKRQNNGQVPGPLTAEDGELVMNRFGLPQYDLNKLGDPSALLDSLGPQFKMPIEYMMNQRTNGAPVKTPTGMAGGSGLGNIIGKVEDKLGMPRDGRFAPKDIGGKMQQQDVMSWLMSAFPTGFLGSTAASSDPSKPNIDQHTLETLMKFIGASPSAISGSEQKYEVLDRVNELKRQAKMKLILER